MDLDECEADVANVRRCELDPSPRQETETVQMWQQQQQVVTPPPPLVQMKKLRRLRMSPLNVSFRTSAGRRLEREELIFSFCSL